MIRFLGFISCTFGFHDWRAVSLDPPVSMCMRCPVMRNDGTGELYSKHLKRYLLFGKFGKEQHDTKREN